MPAKTTKTVTKPAAKKPAAKATKAATTSVRYSAVPKSTAVVAKSELTFAQIAERAFSSACSGEGGSEFDNWLRAENELRAGA